MFWSVIFLPATTVYCTLALALNLQSCFEAPMPTILLLFLAYDFPIIDLLQLPTISNGRKRVLHQNSLCLSSNLLVLLQELILCSN